MARRPPRDDHADPAGPGTPERARGAPRFGASTPRMENIRVTAPDLARRASVARTRGRLIWSGLGFCALFALLAVRLAIVTVLFPTLPPPARVAETSKTLAVELPKLAEPVEVAASSGRAPITDRNGQLLAVSLPTAEVYANPQEMADLDEVVAALHKAVPRIDPAPLRERLAREQARWQKAAAAPAAEPVAAKPDPDDAAEPPAGVEAKPKSFIYVARQITAREEMAINRLGIPGIYFRKTGLRSYPQGRAAAHVLGGVDVDQNGVAGVERAFDARLRSDPSALRLSIDLRVQTVVREELSAAMAEFSAIGATGMVFDVNTGEVIAMVSLPDYDANDFRRATNDERFNRAVTGMYEPGSTFKLQTVAMALDSGAVHLWDSFDAAHPIHIGRFTITDFEGKHRMLEVPEVLAYSSNLGAAHIAETVGGERQRAWLKSMGMFGRIGIQLPEAGRTLYPPVANWGEAATMTIGFGHGIAISPLHVVRATAAVANGGIVRPPTILALPPDAADPPGERVMSQQTSDVMRRLMRLVVTDGYGKPAEVAGYFVGGKTGTAEKVGNHGYKKHTNVAAFMSVFPMNAPRYAVYMMLDEPHATAATHGYATAAWTAAPSAGRVIARAAPMLGLFPQIEQAAAIQASLAIPLQPGRPAGAHAPSPPPRDGGKPMAGAAPPGPARPPMGASATPIPTLAAPVPVDPADRVPQPRQRTEADPPSPALRVADAQAHASR